MQKKKDTFKSLYALFTGWEKVLNAFKSEIFSLPPTEGSWHSSDLPSHLKILTK